MTKILPLLGILMTITFSTVLGQITGNYKSAEYNLFERGLLYLNGVESFIGGMDLTLESDSSFYMISCSMTKTGKWSILHDSLYLEVLTKRWRIDSLNYSKEHVEWMERPFHPIIYKIIENGFYREMYLTNEKKGKIKAADKLIKSTFPKR